MSEGDSSNKDEFINEVEDIQQSKGNSAVVKMKLNGFETNTLLDSGSKWSVTDLGSLSVLGLEDRIEKNNDNLINASGDEMDIIGVLSVYQ